MLKKMSLRKIAVTSVSLFLVALIYLFPSNDKLSINKSVNYIDENDVEVIYLIDKNNYVSEVNISIDNDILEEKLKEKLEILTDNKKTDKLPNGFKSIIPKNTEVLSLEVDKGICTVNFSKEFLGVSAIDEERLIESIIFTLTEEENVSKVIIKVEGNTLERLPNSNKLLPNILDRTYGINKNYDINSLYNLTKTTIYYSSEEDGLKYYVPVTKITNNNDEKVTVIVNELKSSLLYQSNLSSYLNSKAELKKYELEEEVMNLTFNDKIFDSIYDKNILEEVVYTIGKSIKENYNVKSVVFYVDDSEIISF